MADPARPIRVLLVEDSPSDVALTEVVFGQAKTDIQLDVANDGIEALEYLEARDCDMAAMPDLILLDLNMPRMGGHEVLERLKAHEHWRRIPVIVLTTSKAEADILGVYDRHANSYIAKPVDLPEFIDVVSRIEDYWLSVVQLPTRTGS
ncbi:response regulator [Euzebya pacifica]|jgi:CheY-like chemotaxis protein|uniref:response regulator n=1 Tax=Euzebya pacifica TaxID=1608957 RepID=UPI0030FAE1C7